MQPKLAFIAIAAALVVGQVAGAAAPEQPASADKAAAADPAIEALERLRLSIQRVTLDNGLRVVLNVDRSSPTVAVAVTYDVGSRDEVPGRSGFAHLFEHMMFQGSRNVGKGDHFTLISARGGTLNGTTSVSRTNYYEMLPANELALGLWLEADRMKWLEVTPENFENQRAVVQEEYRMRVENAAYRQAMIRLGELVYKDYWPYGHPTIGSMRDLNQAKFDWVKAFHEQHYAPNNAVLTVAGDFDADQAMELIRNYFGDSKPQKRSTDFQPGTVPEQTAERREVMIDPHAKTPGLFWGWVIADTRSRDHYALELAAMVLADGESSRLHQLFVRDRALARDVSAWTSDHPGPDDLTLMVLFTEKADLKTVEQLLGTELDKLAKKGPDPNELSKSKNRLRTHFIFALQSNLERAIRLGEFESYYGDARLLTRELEQYLAITPDDVKRTVAKYLTPTRRTAIVVEPAKGAAK
jgi:predicted Zn-dependent peptidase